MSDQALLDAMRAAAAEAAAFIAERAPLATELVWVNKDRTDFVSEVDTGAESRIERVLRAQVAEPFTLVGEEHSPEAALDAPLAFVVDPLDGTTNFLHGYPWFAVSIAAVRAGRLVAGIVHNVPTGERYEATAGGGAWRIARDGARRAMRVSSIDDPGRALIGTGFPFKHPELIAPYLPAFERVMHGVAGIRRAGSASLDLADVASGRFDAFWELMLAPWDMAAGILLVREAGGLVTDLEGREAPVDHGGIVAGNAEMHAWLLRQIREGQQP